MFLHHTRRRTTFVHIANPTRSNSVSKFYFIFIWSSKCFGRYTVHHQELKTALAASGFAYVEGCWTCCWTLSESSVQQLHVQQPSTYTKPEAASAVLGSWWWAVCRSKHVELNINMKQIFDTVLHLVFSMWIMLLCPDLRTSSTTFGKTPLDEWSARRRDLNLTTHNAHNRQTSVLPVGFEPTVASSQRPQTYALDRAATGTLVKTNTEVKLCFFLAISQCMNWIFNCPRADQMLSNLLSPCKRLSRSDVNSVHYHNKYRKKCNPIIKLCRDLKTWLYCLTQ
jgi:hypothetical protein